MSHSIEEAEHRWAKEQEGEMEEKKLENQLLRLLLYSIARGTTEDKLIDSMESMESSTSKREKLHNTHTTTEQLARWSI